MHTLCTQISNSVSRYTKHLATRLPPPFRSHQRLHATPAHRLVFITSIDRRQGGTAGRPSACHSGGYPLSVPSPPSKSPIPRRGGSVGRPRRTSRLESSSECGQADACSVDSRRSSRSHVVARPSRRWPRLPATVGRTGD